MHSKHTHYHAVSLHSEKSNVITSSIAKRGKRMLNVVQPAQLPIAMSLTLVVKALGAGVAVEAAGNCYYGYRRIYCPPSWPKFVT